MKKNTQKKNSNSNTFQMGVAYPGSFDPITSGHRDIIKRVQSIFGHVVVLISNSPKKNYLFTPEERQKMAMESLKDIPNVKIMISEELTVHFLKKHKISILIRGLRAVSDFENELAMATMNKKLAPEIETMIVFTSPEYNYVSSHMVKEVAIYGGDVRELVPANVQKALVQKLGLKAKK